jgi:hypothetical protein
MHGYLFVPNPYPVAFDVCNFLFSINEKENILPSFKRNVASRILDVAL